MIAHAARQLGPEALDLARRSPSTFANAHGCTVAEAIAVIQAELEKRRAGLPRWRR